MIGEDAVRTARSEAVVYLPSQDSPSMSGIQAGSAIVGVPEGPDKVLVYYEDDPGGAVNLATFGQRALVAYERLVDRAPTHKFRVVPRDALCVIGTYSRSQRRVTLAGSASEMELEGWLGTRCLTPNKLQA